MAKSKMDWPKWLAAIAALLQAIAAFIKHWAVTKH